jgi:hypothetical protein
MRRPVLLGIVALFATQTIWSDVRKGGFGAEKEGSPSKTERKSDAAPKRSSYPFYGTLDSVDLKEKTITLRGKKKNRVLVCTSESRFFKNGASATLADAVPGERISGSVHKNSEGKEVALTIRFGTKPASK